MFDPRCVSPTSFKAHALDIGIREPNVRPILGAVIGHGELDPAQWYQRGLISKDLARCLLPLPSLRLSSTVASRIDGFQKLLFHAEDNYPIETVIIPLHKENKVSVCLSSQVGCVMGCRFCATARMKRRRNLQSWEILDQLRQAREVATANGKTVSGVVFMGMGEPFLNYKNVLMAAEHMCFPVKNAISSKAITISTVGIVDKIDRFIAEERPFRLSISIAAATDEKRAQLIPVAAHTSLARVLESARRYSEARRDRINLAYVCISGENMFVEDAKALGAAIGDLPVRLDLIDVTDTSGRFKAPSEAEVRAFRDALNVYLKQPVARRYSGGADINAACGTLAGGDTGSNALRVVQ